MDTQTVKAEMTDVRGSTVCMLKVPGLKREVSEGKALYRDYARPGENEVTLTLVPYYFWNNRGEGEMQVWMRV